MPLLTKPPQPAAIPVVPQPVPQRTDRANFAERGDKLMAWMPPGMSGVQAHSDYMAAAVAYVDQESERAQYAQAEAQNQALIAQEWAGHAMTTAHYKGPWPTLAGALARPATVSHLGLYYTLNADLPNVAAAEPGASEAWSVLPGLTELATPINQSPEAGAVGVGAVSQVVLQANAFASVYVGESIAGAQWQISAVNAFAVPAYDSGVVAGAVSHTVPNGALAAMTMYWWRVRYRSPRGTWSAWSRATAFTTSTFEQYIPNPEPTPASFGKAFQGGYYAGMVWQEIARATQLNNIATGVRTFVLDVAYDMYAKALVYKGQLIEVRSRANPDNRFSGAVVTASGRMLTINVTSVAGAGAASDWSIMARHRCIVAPKSSGRLTDWRALKPGGGALPAACVTLTDGWAATAAMVADGDATVYPLAHWARNLTIGGYTDWYLPARDEIELIARNLNNGGYGTFGRTLGVALAAQAGAWGYVANDGIGTNRNSAPQGAAYGGFVMDPSSDFRVAGQQFEVGNYGIHMWSSTRHPSTVTAAATMQMGGDRDNTYYQGWANAADITSRGCSAMRRSIV